VKGVGSSHAREPTECTAPVRMPRPPPRSDPATASAPAPAPVWSFGLCEATWGRGFGTLLQPDEYVRGEPTN